MTLVSPIVFVMDSFVLEKVKVRSSKPLVIKLKVEVKVLANLNRAFKTSYFLISLGVTSFLIGKVSKKYGGWPRLVVGGINGRGKLQIELVSTRMTFRFITHGTKENIVALKETIVFRKQHGSCVSSLYFCTVRLAHLDNSISCAVDIKSAGTNLLN